MHACRKIAHVGQALTYLTFRALAMLYYSKDSARAHVTSVGHIHRPTGTPVIGYRLSVIRKSGKPPIIPFVPFLIISEPEFFFFPNNQQPITQ